MITRDNLLKYYYSIYILIISSQKIRVIADNNIQPLLPKTVNYTFQTLIKKASKRTRKTDYLQAFDLKKVVSTTNNGLYDFPFVKPFIS
jgi:translation initiation factor RLI1